MTDDLSMGALSGNVRSRAVRAIKAGCDLVLHCNGDLMEMIDVASGVPELAGDALRRADAALAFRRPPGQVDRKSLEARFDFLLGQVAVA